jgi:hypothetical protein
MHERTRMALAATAAAVAVGGLAACGDDEERRANNPRPPTLKLITGSISDSRVSVSPATFGAGPIDLLVTNQSGTAQRVTLASDDAPGSGPGIRQVTAPINPRDTARLSATVQPGRYRVQVSGPDIRPARLVVGAPRPSAQNDLLLP